MLQVKTECSSLIDDNELTVNPMWLDNFIITYQSLAVDNLSGLAKLYHQEISFQDPLHTINGLNQLTEYFNNLYQNVTECKFVIHQVLLERNQAAIYWTMTYAHQRLNKGNAIVVEGNSLIIGEKDKVVFHRDYIDLGQMLYENIPVMGGVIRWLKRRITR